MNPVAERHRLELHHFGVAVAAFGLGAIMAVMQSLARADIEVPFRTEALYYLSVTAHGVLMGLVFTTFFIMGLGYLFARETLGKLALESWAWVSYWVAVGGTALAAAAILTGKATVLYTFYPPLQAHPTFYIGATLLVIGSWGFCVVLFASVKAWRREHAGEPIPLPVHGMIATAVIWLLATFGLAIEVLTQLIPWSLGWVEKIDPVIARTWFWWFGHPLTYFWLVPAYVVWYTVVPRAIGGRLFSDTLARAVFVMFIVFSTPVGFHHQFADPGVSSGWKLLHTITTYAILFPSLVTAFTVIASFEVAGRLKGKKGLFDWITALPWKDPLFSSVALAMITFAIGGWGGAINAAYAMNTMVHNTAWIQGHFHLTVGTAVALTFLGVTYWILPRLTGRELALKPLAQMQPYLWFVGMIFFSWTNHVTGILGMPRRVFSAAYDGSPVAARWETWTALSAFGGIILFVSSLFFLLVVIATLANARRLDPVPRFEFAVPLEPAQGGTRWDRIGFWTTVAVVLIVLAYAYPIYHLYAMERFGSVGYRPW